MQANKRYKSVQNKQKLQRQCAKQKNTKCIQQTNKIKIQKSQNIDEIKKKIKLKKQIFQ